DLGYPVAHDDPLIIAALCSVVLHENLQNREILLIERLIERMERYESNIQDAARLLNINTALSAEMKAGLDISAKQIATYNSNAAKLADKHGQILRVENNGGTRLLATIITVGFVMLGILLVLLVK
ncbi:hypothetical protein QG053_11850, partial [Kingella kingae]|uniref:hypothetical protein n=1 Tax=Kingella kingae TaxID=504 RepID=UPI00254C8F9F